jgi:hypothetical protein
MAPVEELAEMMVEVGVTPDMPVISMERFQ